VKISRRAPLRAPVSSIDISDASFDGGRGGDSMLRSAACLLPCASLWGCLLSQGPGSSSGLFRWLCGAYSGSLGYSNARWV
jgi:hypothetical protein